MSISLSGGFRPTDFSPAGQVQDIQPATTAEISSTDNISGCANIQLEPLRDSLDISLRAAINTMLASNPLVSTLSNSERAELINAVEFSLKQGLGISTLLRTIQNRR